MATSEEDDDPHQISHRREPTAKAHANGSRGPTPRRGLAATVFQLFVTDGSPPDVSDGSPGSRRAGSRGDSRPASGLHFAARMRMLKSGMPAGLSMIGLATVAVAAGCATDDKEGSTS